MKFSILLPVYYKDNATYLDEAIISLLNQSLIPNEILVLVDGAVDTSIDNVLKKYKAIHSDIINIIYFEKNRGLGLLLNDGVKLAKYDIIGRMDSDDISLPTRFESQINSMIKFNADVIGGQVIEYTEDMKNKIGLKNVPCNHSDIKKYIKRRNPINHMSVMFKKDVVLKSGNYKDFKGFEDYVLWFDILKKGYKIINSPDIFVKVRAGNSMLERRRGYSYFRKEYEVQKYFFYKKYINIFDFIINFTIRLFVRFVPIFITKIFYEKKLRTKY